MLGVDPAGEGVGSKGGTMPLYIDHHKKLEGLTAEVVAEDHKKGRNLKGRFTGFPPKLILGD
jgi:hypothetical protein